jgi:putative tricarboxylic transport membrane protein
VRKGGGLVAAAVVLVAGVGSARAGSGLSILAPAAPGGGWDQTARALQRALAAVDPQASVQVDNVPGAAGTIGLARFVQAERGNPRALMVTGLVMVSGIITNRSPVTLADVAPIARLTGEFEVIVVPARSPHASLADLIRAFRENPGGVSWGGGSAGGTDELLVRLLAEAVGVAPARVNYVAFSGGGAALAAMLSGQLSAGVSGYSEFAGQIEAGELRVLAVSSPSRVAGITAPTIREAGIDLDLANWRAIVAPPGLSEAEREALTAVMTRAVRSDAWKASLAQNGWDDLFLTGPPLKQFLLAEQARVGAVLQRLGASGGDATRARWRLTPETLPWLSVALLAIVAAGSVLSGSSTRAPIHAPGAVVVLGAVLLLQPLALTRAGFVFWSTLLFVTTAWALGSRRPARDLACGFLLAAGLFVLFGRGLGVELPAAPVLGGWL